MQRVKVIAEIAHAHQGDPRILEELVRAAAQSGGDGIKFQWYKYDHLATSDYSYYQVYKDLFIPETVWHKTILLAKKSGLEVWIDIFDDWGLELANRFNNMIDGYKIPSTVIQSECIVQGIFSLKKPVILGVGGWYENELDHFIDRINTDNLNNPTLIHGFQGYPTKTEDTNLIRINYLKNRYQLPVGYADHEDGSTPLAIDLPMYAVLAGATVIEKHLTIDRSTKGYDYYSALEPDEFRRMVTKLRETEILIGTTQVKQTERHYLKDSVRVIAKKDIPKGEILTEDSIVYKRCPVENALTPWQLALEAPLLSKEDLHAGQPLQLKHLDKPRITIAVVCRLKSTRLPKKALLPIYGLASIERCLHNCLAVSSINHIVLATSYLPEDDPLEQYSMDGRVKILRGDPDNIASRLIQVAEETDANIIVRVTGDCPAVSPEILEILIQKHLENGPDLTIPTAEHAPGTAGDVYTVSSLHRLLRQTKPLTHTEYLSFYYVNNPNLFNVQKVKLPGEFRNPTWRLTLDELDDLALFQRIYSDLDIRQQPLSFRTLNSYLIDEPHLAQTNSHVPLKWKDDPVFGKELLDATSLN